MLIFCDGTTSPLPATSRAEAKRHLRVHGRGIAGLHTTVPVAGVNGSEDAVSPTSVASRTDAWYGGRRTLLCVRREKLADLVDDAAMRYQETCTFARIGYAGVKEAPVCRARLEAAKAKRPLGAAARSRRAERASTAQPGHSGVPEHPPGKSLKLDP